MDHSPYSSDLALSDFWSFDYIKQRLEISITESLAPQIVEQDETIPHQESI